MHTLKELVKNSPASTKLTHAVICQLGGWETAKESLLEIAQHGINGGFCGFVYYSDTVSFFKRHRSDIAKLAENQARELGENVAEMVAGFGCLAGRRGKLAEYLPSVSRCLYGGRITENDTQVANALAWFAGEEVARAWADMNDD